MKTLKLFAIMAVCLFMAACGGTDEAGKVASKIKDGSQLTEQDYTVMIDYCGRFAKEAQGIQDEINKLPVNSPENQKLEDKMASLSDKYESLAVFSEKISTCTQEEIGAENVKKVNEYAPLMWFSAPEWASIGTDTGVEGFIEDMPSTDTTGVISTGDGVEVK